MKRILFANWLTLLFTFVNVIQSAPICSNFDSLFGFKTSLFNALYLENFVQLTGDIEGRLAVGKDNFIQMVLLHFDCSSLSPSKKKTSVTRRARLYDLDFWDNSVLKI